MSAGWTLGDDGLIASNYPDHGPSWERWWCNGGDLLEGRSYSAIVARASRIGVRCTYRGPKSWRRDQDEVALRAVAEVCRMTGKSPVAVVRRMDHLVEAHMARLRAERLGVVDEGRWGREQRDTPHRNA